MFEKVLRKTVEGNYPRLSADGGLEIFSVEVFKAIFVF